MGERRARSAKKEDLGLEGAVLASDPEMAATANIKVRDVEIEVLVLENEVSWGRR